MHKLLYIVFVVFLFLSGLNQFTGTVKIKKLDGFIKNNENNPPNFTIQNYLSQQWQDSLTTYISKDLISKPAFVRFRNFFDYKIFDEVHVNNVFKGKDDFLFYGTEHYLKGQSFIPLDSMCKNVNRLKFLQDSLRKNGKTLLYVIAPEKMFVYPEKMPDKYPLTKKMRFTYDNYTNLFNQSNVDYIDFNQWFLTLKDTTSCALFAKGGKHWTHYYATLAADSIGDFLRKKGVNVNDLTSIKSVANHPVWREDVDIRIAANLPFHFEEKNIVGVDVKANKSVADNVIFLSDSYFNILTWSGLFKDQYGEKSEFWYYNKVRNDVNNISLGETSKKIFLEKKMDAYIILISVGNLKSFDFGFMQYYND